MTLQPIILLDCQTEDSNYTYKKYQRVNGGQTFSDKAELRIFGSFDGGVVTLSVKEADSEGTEYDIPVRDEAGNILEIVDNTIVQLSLTAYEEVSANLNGAGAGTKVTVKLYELRSK